MAENIYSKGTRVWFEDKDHAWISAEVVSSTKGNDDSIKLVFVDERGKVNPLPLRVSSFSSCYIGNHDKYHGKSDQGGQRRPTTSTQSPVAGNS